MDGNEALASFPRLAEDSIGGAGLRGVAWKATGSMRSTPGYAEAQPWLQLSAETALPMTCQRCLQPVEVQVAFDRLFRFAADEPTAEREDEDAEEDVLAMRQDFSLLELVEDELLLALPAFPMHEVCPVEPLASVEDAAFEEAGRQRQNPFAVLQSLVDKPLGK